MILAVSRGGQRGRFELVAIDQGFDDFDRTCRRKIPVRTVFRRADRYVVGVSFHTNVAFLCRENLRDAMKGGLGIFSHASRAAVEKAEFTQADDQTIWPSS